MRSPAGLSSGSPTFTSPAGGRSFASKLRLLAAAAVLTAATWPAAAHAQGVTIAVAPPRWIPGGGVVVHGQRFGFYRDETQSIQGRLRRHEACRPIRLRVTLDLEAADFVLTHQYDPNAFRHHEVVLYDHAGEWVTDTRTMGLNNAVKDVCNDLREILGER